MKLYETFQLRGLALAPRLRYLPDAINEAVGILHVTLGDDWLSATESDQALGPWRVEGHPIRHQLRVAGETQIVDLLELCHYLKALPAAASKQIIDSLKAQYAHTLLQLAFAYRFANVGASNVQLEPPVTGGASDIAFAYGGAQFVAECYAPQANQRGGPEEELDLLSKALLDQLEARQDFVCVGVKLLEALRPKIRKEIAQAVQTALKTRLDTALFFKLSGAFVSVAPGEPAAEGRPRPIYVHPDLDVSNEPNLSGSISAVPASQVFSLTDRGPRGIALSNFGIWRESPPATREAVRRGAAAVALRLAKKAKQKLRQTKRPDRPGRILLVETWVASDYAALEVEDLEDLRKQTVLAHSGVAGVVLVVGDQLKPEFSDQVSV